VAQEGFDLCLTEVVGKQKHYFLCQAGTKVGKKLVSDLGFEAAQETDILPALEAVQQAEKKIKRKLNTRDLPKILNRNFDHPRWEKTGERCLSCGNCTMVCPTCFCVTVEETTDLTGDVAERWRRWDSCFTADFSYIHGGGVRQSTKSRYRQWMSHKLSHWVEQFGSLGCVGCGRCLTWCPVGIDITEEAAFIREHDQALQSKKKTMEAGHEDD
jgi:ferredoxin